MADQAPPFDPMLPEPFTIRRVLRETHDSFTFELEPPSGRFDFKPGQFNMLYAFGVGEVPISISGDASQPETLVHTVRAVGAVTKALQRFEAGDVVGVRGPYGKPWPVDAAKGRDLLIVAGGIGLAPLRPVIYHALNQRDDFDKLVLLYGSRSPRDILFDAQLIEWRGRFDMHVDVTVDQGTDGWRGKTGVVTHLIDRVDFDPANTVAMMCGPEIMMRFCARELAAQGLPDDRCYVTLERNMQCAIAQCGHCQYGAELLCRDGAVYRYDRVARLMTLREV
jgi:NAD(P)H-flavin reductase